MFPRRRPGLISQKSATDSAPPEAQSPKVDKIPPAQQPPPSTPSRQIQQQYGLYLDGNWYCNCKPRARAKFFHVKKDGPNQHRCFYSCPCPDKEDNCDFFLWLEEAEERVAAMGGPDSAPATVSSSRPKNNSILKYFKSRDVDGEPSDHQETPSRKRGNAKDVDGEASALPPLPVNDQEGRREEKRPADKPSAPSVRANHSDHPPAPSTPTPARGRKRAREETEDEIILSDLSSGEEEQYEQILSAASRGTNMSPPTATAPTPTRHGPDLPLATPIRPATVGGTSSALPTPSTRALTSLAAKRRRVLDSTTSGPASSPSPSSPQTPHANPAASIGDDISAVRAVLKQHSDPAVSASLGPHLDRIANKVSSAIYSRNMVRETLKARDKQIAQLKERNVALENEVRGLREGMTKLRGGMLNLYKDT